MNSQVTAIINNIQNDRDHGANWLSREALSAMKLTATTSQATTPQALIEDLTIAGKTILDSKPSMAPIHNVISQLLSHTTANHDQYNSIQSLRTKVIETADTLINDSLIAIEKVAQLTSKLIKNGDTLMTCSYSSTMCRTFKIAKSTGIDFSVLTAQSNSQDGQSYGEKLASEISSHGVSIKIIPDKHVKELMPTTNIAIIGADTIFHDGSIINGTPSHDVASAAKHSNVPFYSAGETNKINSQNAAQRNIKLEPGFDLLPTHLITAIVTEYGIMSPGELPSRDSSKHLW